MLNTAALGPGGRRPGYSLASCVCVCVCVCVCDLEWSEGAAAHKCGAEERTTFINGSSQVTVSVSEKGDKTCPLTHVWEVVILDY